MLLLLFQGRIYMFQVPGPYEIYAFSNILSYSVFCCLCFDKTEAQIFTCVLFANAFYVIFRKLLPNPSHEDLLLSSYVSSKRCIVLVFRFRSLSQFNLYIWYEVGIQWGFFCCCFCICLSYSGSICQKDYPITELWSWHPYQNLLIKNIRTFLDSQFYSFGICICLSYVSNVLSCQYRCITF